MTTHENDLPLLLTIAVLGGTGKEGSGLAMRWALNGYRVIIGSRDAERAAEHAKELNAELGGDYLSGSDNAQAAADANIVVLSVPYAAHKATLEGVKDQLQGKILIDITVPNQPPDIRTVWVPPRYQRRCGGRNPSELPPESVSPSVVRNGVPFDNVRSAEPRA